MKILHIAPHLGGGIGKVVSNLIRHSSGDHEVISLLNTKDPFPQSIVVKRGEWNRPEIANNDVVIVHWWDHYKVVEFFYKPIPPCRLVFWCHKNYAISDTEKMFPDRFIYTSPVQGEGEYIWSTGGVGKYLHTGKTPHQDFTIGYIGTVDYKKMHTEWVDMCMKIRIPSASVNFLVAGTVNIPTERLNPQKFKFLGYQENIKSVLSMCDIFGYPLNPDHYGTCEQVLGEAMAAGVVPVVMDNKAERIILPPDRDGMSTGIKCRTPEEYVKAIKWLYNNKGLRELTAKRAQKWAVELYSTDKMVERWKKVLKEMMDHPKRERGVMGNI